MQHCMKAGFSASKINNFKNIELFYFPHLLCKICMSARPSSCNLDNGMYIS